MDITVCFLWLLHLDYKNDGVRPEVRACEETKMQIKLDQSKWRTSKLSLVCTTQTAVVGSAVNELHDAVAAGRVSSNVITVEDWTSSSSSTIKTATRSSICGNL